MTKTVFIKFAALACAVMCLFTCAACGDKNTASVSYTEPKSYNAANSGIVNENDNFILSWDKEMACILLEQKSNGHVWASIPFDFYSGDDNNAILQSPLVVEYMDTEDNAAHEKRIYVSCIKKKNFDAVIENNKLTVTFVLEDLEFIIPVVFSLESDGLRVSIDSSEVLEGVNPIIAISVLPYLASVKNDNPDSYIFVPSGSGALMYTDTALGNARTYKSEYFGDDTTRQLIKNPTTNESLKLPVFGVKDGENSLFAVIDEGADCCELIAEAGNQKTGYSIAYSKFNLRAHDIISARNGSNQEKEVYQYANEKLSEGSFSTIYYPLTGEAADYKGMADKYWSHLEKDGASVLKTDESMLTLSILGGIEVDDFMLGIPYRNLYDLTNFSEAEKIISEISKETSQKPVVSLKGFGTTGLNPGQVGGGFKFASDYGNKDDLKKLIANASGKTSAYYFDFEIARFYKNGAGFSTIGDAAKTAKDQRAHQYPQEKNIRVEDDDFPSYILLARGSFNKAFDKLSSFANKNGISGVSVGSLSSICYSDNGNTKYFARANMENQVSEKLKSLKKSGLGVLASDANSYAAVNANNIINAPFSTDKSFAFDKEVPFYQMVFKGRIPINSQAVNNSGDERKQILKAVSYGMGINYNLIYNYDTIILDSNISYLSSSVYEDNKSSIKSAVKEFAPYYKAINGATIESYTELGKGVTETVYSNGVSVIVNISDNDFTQNGETVEAMNFIMKGES